MDPESGPTKFKKKEINKNHTYFKENQTTKTFIIAYFNDSSRSLVTCHATFDKNYNLISYKLNVILLKNNYQEIKQQSESLPLSDLLRISKKFENNDRLFITYNKKTKKSHIKENKTTKEIPPIWVLDYALKEDKESHMDIPDKIIDYLCTKLINDRLVKNIEPFKQIQLAFTPKQKTITKTLN